MSDRSARLSGGRLRRPRAPLGGGVGFALALATGGSIALAGAAPAPAAAASSYILCQPHAGRLGNRVAKAAPRRCDTLSAREPLAARSRFGTTIRRFRPLC